jgi:predicted Na+-dependent transporter
MTTTQSITTFLRTQGKGLSLLLTMAVGMLFPQAHVFSPAIQSLLMVMLFFAFLDIEFKPQSFRKSALWILVANLTIAFASYAILAPFNLTLALAAFMTGIAPTGIAAPVIIGFIQGAVEYVVASVLLTNLSTALIVPLTLPFLLGQSVQISVWEVLQPVLIVMFAPLHSPPACPKRRKPSSAKGKSPLSPSGWSTCSSSAPTPPTSFAPKPPLPFRPCSPSP